MRAAAAVAVHDPVAPLLAAGGPAIAWAVRHDLFHEQLDARALWDLPAVVRARRTQNPDGSWTYRGGTAAIRPPEDYDQLATYTCLLELVSKYRLDRREALIERAAEFLLRFQKPEGDLRGIYGTQYTPNYTADILRLLIEAGYGDDARVLNGLEWLLSMRLDDGGWAVPARTAGDHSLIRALTLPRPLQPKRDMPSSHLITGIVLRAFAVQPVVRERSEIRNAALLLAGRFFTPDAYSDRRAASYWTKLAFPFRWTDVVSSLDAIGRMRVDRDHPAVAGGLRWVREHQLPSGMWRSGYRNSPDPLADHWVTLATSRALLRFRAPSRPIPALPYASPGRRPPRRAAQPRASTGSSTRSS